MTLRSIFTEIHERSAGNPGPLYRTGLTAVDKTYLAVNSVLFKEPEQLGAKYAKIFTHLDLTAPAISVDIEPWIRRIKADKLVDPTGVLVSLNAEVAYTAYTTEAKDDDSATIVNLDALDTLANGDAFFVGYSDPFVGISCEVAALNKNANAAILAAHYNNGAGYQALSIQDQTKLAGATLNHDGEIYWSLPSDWVKTTKNGISAYWVRFTVSAALSAAVDIEEIGVLLGYAYAGKIDLINLPEAGRFAHDISIDNDDLAVLLRTINGAGVVSVDINLGWH